MGRGSTARVEKGRAGSGLDIRRRGSRDLGPRAVAISMPAAARDSRGLARMGRDKMRLAPTARFPIAAPAASARSGLARAAARVVPARVVPMRARPGRAVPVTARRGRVASEPDHVPAASDLTALAPTVHGRADRVRAAIDPDPPASAAALAPAASGPMRPDPTSTPELIATAAPPRPPGVSGSQAGSGHLSRLDRPVVGSAVRGPASRPGRESAVRGRSRRGPASRPGLRPAIWARATPTKRPANTARPAVR
jgi:hypothetical protein